MVTISHPIVLDRTRTYVVGDIHGRSDLLDRMVEHISRDLDASPISDCMTVTLGDYIDRGPDSRGVLDRLVRNPFPMDFIALKGNHEALLEMFLDDPAVAEHWRRLGGLETLHSYGVPVSNLMMGANYEQAARALELAVPGEHFKFLASLKTSIITGKYFLCHGAYGRALHSSVEDLLWIRDEFLNSTMDFGMIVVHGHTPSERPEVLPNRINIDTGAFATGRLTCVVLEGAEPRFLMTA